MINGEIQVPVSASDQVPLDLLMNHRRDGETRLGFRAHQEVLDLQGQAVGDLITYRVPAPPRHVTERHIVFPA